MKQSSAESPIRIKVLD